MEGEKTNFKTLLESVEERVFNYTAQINQDVLRKKIYKRGGRSIKPYTSKE